MAAATNAIFKMPQEPCPLPSLGSDEESFVVLGQSISDVSTDLYSEPIGLSVIEEAKRLINSELEAIEQTKNKPEEKKESLEASNVAEDKLSKMETSAVLPAMPHIDKGCESNNAISLISFTADMSSEEVQNKVAQIIEENIHLKDTILQNNMSLKSQYERIVAWQEDVQRVHQAHKEKLLEAKGFIESLKREKETLKRDLAKLVEDKKNQDQQIEELKKLLKEKETVTNEVLVKRSDDNIKEFQLEVANKKIKDLEAEVEQLSREHEALMEEAIKIGQHEEDTVKKMGNLEDVLKEMAIANRHFVQKETKLKSQEEEMTKINELEPELKKLIEEWNDANIKIVQLQNEISAINAVGVKREQSLIITINSLKAQLEMMQSNPEEIANLRTQVAQTQTALTQMEYTRAQAYSQVGQLTEELSDVRNQLDELQSQKGAGDVDVVFALNTQLDIYKTDFEEERRAREVIKEEKDRLEEDLQNIQRRNQQLQEEIEMIRREHDYVVYPSQSSARRPEREPSSSRDLLRCPKCGFGFNNIQALESHVHKCLDLDDHLP